LTLQRHNRKIVGNEVEAENHFLVKNG